MTDSIDSEMSLRRRVANGELAANDELGTLLYHKGAYAEAADHYLKAYVGGFYKSNERPESSQNLHRMHENNWIPTNSDAYRLFQHLQTQGDEVRERSTKAATTVTLATFIGYIAIVYMGGVHGVLREFSLIIAGALAWACWKLVSSSFQE